MIGICIYGRGGQGAQVAGQIIATAFYRSKYRVQNFSSYGGAIRGGLVSSYIRADSKPIFLRCNIEKPDLIVFFDASLIEDRLIANIEPNTVVLVNTSKTVDSFSSYGLKPVMVDALGIAAEHGLGRIVNTAMVGAIAGATGWLETSTLSEVVRELSPVKKDQNVAACIDSYAWAYERRGADVG